MKTTKAKGRPGNLLSLRGISARPAALALY